MLYALICTDKPGALDIRRQSRPDHLAFLEGLGEQLKLAGPFLDEGGNPNGSLVIIEAESREAAQALAAQDPYARAGLFADVEVRPWNWAVKKPDDL
jgi:uncharacterized protein YciI